MPNAGLTASAAEHPLYSPDCRYLSWLKSRFRHHDEVYVAQLGAEVTQRQSPGCVDRCYASRQLTLEHGQILIDRARGAAWQHDPSMDPQRFVVIGAGILGLATAREIRAKLPHS